MDTQRLVGGKARRSEESQGLALEYSPTAAEAPNRAGLYSFAREFCRVSGSTGEDDECIAASHAGGVLGGRVMPSAMTAGDDLTGQFLKGRYRVVKLLDGSGGMADVYIGEDVRVGRTVVIKLPKMSLVETGARRRFLEEIRLLVGMSELHSKHIVPVFDAEISGERPFLVMPFMPGGNLIKWARSHPPICDDPGLHVRQWMMAIATALDCLHEQGLVHRDVKAANILFDAQGSAVLADFGIVKAKASSQLYRGHDLTVIGTAPGTPGYIAPEILCFGGASGQADQYALAVTMYVLLTPERVLPVPVTRDPDRFRKPIKPLDEHDPRIPRGVSRTVLRALAVDPKIRFRTCVEFVEAFDRAWSPQRKKSRKKWASAHPRSPSIGWRNTVDRMLGAMGLVPTTSSRIAGSTCEYRLRHLSAETARSMAAQTTPLRLHSITKVTTEVARILADHAGGILSLGGLDRLDPEIARAFSAHTGQLLLDGLRVIARDAAKELAQHRGGLSLNGLQRLDPSVAEFLVMQRGRLALGGLREVADDVARVLGRHGGELQLDGVERLDPRTAEILARRLGPMSLNGLVSIDRDVAEHLARHTNTLWLCGVRRLDEETAVALAAHRGLLFLPRLGALSERASAALCRNPAVRLADR